MTDIKNLQRRIKNQRKALRNLEAFALRQEQWAQRELREAQYWRKAYEGVCQGYWKSLRYRVWIYFRNRIVWRIGRFIRGNSSHWQQRTFYEKGYREGFAACNREFFEVKVCQKKD